MVDGIATVDEEKCVDCNTCVDVCPSAAISPAE
ncbi:MAG TPA: 4Fe-4S binding protein [Methanoregulaceae archaeon]|nr:4Fe-4S binding protein [Methanoregulaceae archaeon]